MSVDTTVIADCVVCGGGIISDEPSVGVDANGFYADFGDTELLAHSKCGKQPGTDVVERPEMTDFLPDNLPDLRGSVEEEVASAREKAEAIVVDSPESAQAAVNFAAAIKARAAAIEAESVSLRKPRFDAAKEIKRVYDGVQAPFLEVEAVVKETVADWEQKVREDAAAAQKLIDEERERVEKKAREEKAAAEEAEREAEKFAAEADNEDDAQAATELAAEAKRDAEKAGVMESAIQALPPSGPPPTPKLKGFSTPKRWVAEVVDFDALPDQLPDGTPLKVVDQVALNRWMNGQVKVNGDVAPELPGAVFEKRAGGSRVSS